MIVLELLKDDYSSFKKELDVLTNHQDTLNISNKRLSGEDFVLLFIQLTPATIAAVSAIVIESIKSHKHITIKHNGYEITGLSEKNAILILNKIMEEDTKKNSSSNNGKKS